MPKLDTNAQNMPGHAARIKSGRLRRIRSDTEIGTLEERYGVDFGVRDGMKWGTYQKQYNLSSIKAALELLKRGKQ